MSGPPSTTTTLEHDVDFAGFALRKGTEVEIDDDGILVRAVLAENHVLKGLPCRGSVPALPADGKWTFYTPDVVRFHPAGFITFAFLSEDHIINGIPCKADGVVTFFEESRSLKNFTLAKETTIRGVTYASGKCITLREDGSVEDVSDPHPRPTGL